MLVILIIILFCIWIYYAKASVTSCYYNVLKAFDAIDVILQKQYALSQDIFDSVKNSMTEEKAIIEYSENLKNKVINLETIPENIDRRIALDRELSKQTELVLNAVSNYAELQSNTDIKTKIENYNSLKNLLQEKINEYNSHASKLRTTVDVFPTSFIARLIKIKYLNKI